MPNLTSQGAREFEQKLDDHCERVTSHLTSQRNKVIQYFKHEALCDTNQQWSALDKQYFEEYSSTDIFYVPFRRRVSPDWLQWQRNSRKDKIMFHRNRIDIMYSKYIIYYPGNFIFSSSVHSTYMAPYKINNHPMTGVSKRKTISNNKLWAIIQHKKSYLQDTVQDYDDLMLKYDSNDDPVLHPLLNFEQVYIKHLREYKDNECTGDQDKYSEIYNYFIPAKLHKYDKNIQDKLNLVIKKSEPLEDSEKVREDKLYALPTRYRKKNDEHPFPHWIYINKIESSQIIFSEI